jgi:hypothetical protein
MTDCDAALGGMIHSPETPSVLTGCIVVPRGSNGLLDPIPANARSLGIDEIKESIWAENIFVKTLNT